MEKYVINEASMNFPIKQQVLKSIISLKDSPFARPQLPGFIQASTVIVSNMVIDKNELDSYSTFQSCYNYIQMVSKNVNDIKANELGWLSDKLVNDKFDYIFDLGSNENLDDGYLSVMAVSYSGEIYLRRQTERPDGTSDLDRLLLKGRCLVHGHKDETGKTVVNMKQGYQAFRQAAEMGAPEALFELGVFYHHGIECGKDSQKAKKYLEAAANSASARWSCAAMSFAIENNIGIEIKQ